MAPVGGGWRACSRNGGLFSAIGVSSAAPAARYFFGYAFLCESLHIHRGLNLITSAKEILEEQIKLLTKPKRVDGDDHEGHRSMDRSWNRNS